jgi:hypothetical protein
MAGMIPEKRSRVEIERANNELLQRNHAYMQRWLERPAQDTDRLHEASIERLESSCSAPRETPRQV